MDFRDKLIKELNLQIEEGSFYTLNNSNVISKKNSNEIFDSAKYEQSATFSGLARINGLGVAPQPKNNLDSQKQKSYFDSVKIDGSNLYRPMISSFSNPLDGTAYKYKPTFDLSVNGMAFLSSNGGIVENPLKQPINIVNKVIEKKEITTVAKEENTNLNHLIEPIALNTYKMLDIINDSVKPEEISFAPIPREYSLTIRKNRLKEFLFREIDVWKEIKSLFKKVK